MKTHIDDIESDTFTLPYPVASTETLKDGYNREILDFTPPADAANIDLDGQRYEYLRLSRYVKGKKMVHALSFFVSPVEHPAGVINGNIMIARLVSVHSPLVKGLGLYDVLPEDIQKKLDAPDEAAKQAMVERMTKARAARGKGDGEDTPETTTTTTTPRGRKPKAEWIGIPRQATCVKCKKDVAISPQNVIDKAKVLGITLEALLADYHCRSCGGRLKKSAKA